MMDSSIGWLQPEQKGPALDLWFKFWTDFNKPHENGVKSPKTKEYDQRKMTPNLSCHAKIDTNPSSTTDLDNKPELIQEYKGTPWLKPEDKLKPEIDGLHEEIHMFYQYMRPMPEESQFRRHVFERLKHVIHMLWSDVVVTIFGSFATATYLPTSDIDIVVIHPRFNGNVLLHLIELEEHMVKSYQCRNTEIVRLDRAAVPLLKMIDLDSKFRINIVFNMTKVLHNIELVDAYKKQYPFLVKLLYVIKYFVLERNMNEVYLGGLSSYALVLMIVHFFKANTELVVGINKPNLGELLIKFFELYGKLLNYEKVGLRIADGTYIDKKAILEKTICKASRHQPSPFCVEDPLDPTNNVTRGSYNIPKIRDAFNYAYDMLMRAVGPNSAVVDKNESILGRIIRVTDEVVNRRRTLVAKVKTLPFYNGYRGGRNGHRGGHRWNNPNRWGNNGNRIYPNNYNPRRQWIERHNGQNGHNGHNGESDFTNNPNPNGGQRGQHSRNRFNGNRAYSNGNQRDGSPRFVSYYSFDNNPNHQRKRAQQIYSREDNTEDKNQESERQTNERALNGTDKTSKPSTETRDRSNTYL